MYDVRLVSSMSITRPDARVVSLRVAAAILVAIVFFLGLVQALVGPWLISVGGFTTIGPNRVLQTPGDYFVYLQETFGITLLIVAFGALGVAAILRRRAVPSE
jgi:hypothetical protein